MRSDVHVKSLILAARPPEFASGSPLLDSITMEKTFYLSGSRDNKVVMRI